MSRTYRSNPSGPFRNIKTGSLRRQAGAIQDAIEAAREFDVELSGAVYANYKHIPSSWDDIHVSAWDQIPNKN